LRIRDKWMSGVFLFGVTVTLWVQPSSTYSWVFDEVKDSGHEFVVGLLDISQSSFGNEWKVVTGGNQTIDLSKMIPGDARQLEATLSKGASDLDFRYKITAEIKDGPTRGSGVKLAEVLRIRIENRGDVLFDGLAKELSPAQPGTSQSKNMTETIHRADEPDKVFLITVYLPEEGVNASFQALAAHLQLKFLAKQATPGAIYAE
jgi:hypothetical protein